MAELNRIDEIDERSEQVREVMGKAPSWTVAWGSALIFISLVMLILMSCFIKYPELVKARVVITTPRPPAGVVAQISGKLNPVYVVDKQVVEAGCALAIIENPARMEDMERLKNQLPNIALLFMGSDTVFLHLKVEDHLELGEVQREYALFLKNLHALQSFLLLSPQSRQIAAIKKQVEAYRILVAGQEKQTDLFEQELSFAQRGYARSKELHTEKVIADKDMEDKELELIRVRRGYRNFELDKANTLIQMAELNNTLTALTVQDSESHAQFSRTLRESYDNLVAGMALWNQKYVLRASISGQVTFSNYWTANQFVKSGEEVFVVVPVESSEPIGRVSMPVMNSGKVHKGQRVNVRLDSYPAAEFGSVNGLVESISLVPRNNLYTISVRFPQGLTTTYRRKLPMMQEMEGSAEIVTEEMRLIERIFYQFKNLFKGHG
jgi:multidrug resistance efflux pump